MKRDMNRNAWRRATAVGSCLALAACALKAPPGKDEIRAQALPNLNAPAAWAAKRGDVGAQGAVASGWLAAFNDPQLEALVREALAYNADLRVAAARVEQAAGYAELSGAKLYPWVNAIAGGKGGDSGIQVYGISAGWELDLWGRVRSGREAAGLQYLSAELEAEYARQSITALVAKSWFLATEARLQKAGAEAMAGSSRRLVELSQERLRIGKGDEFDVSLAQASLQTYLDAVQQFDLSYQQAVRALETLAGRYPATTAEVPAQLAAQPGPVPVGVPSELLERRPDVVAAERRVAAAFYRVEEAKAARLPQLSLTGSGIHFSSEIVALQTISNPVWSLGAILLAPLFTGGALKAQVEIRSAEQNLAIAEYGRIGARALGEVENALSSGFTLDQREAILSRAVTENERALEFANTRYRVGSGDLRAVQQQQLALYAARTALLRVRGELLVQRVNLYLALGGGWVAEAGRMTRQ